MASHSRLRVLFSSLFPALVSLSILSASFAPARAQSAIPNVPPNPYGVNVFLHKEVETPKIERTLQMIAAANIPWIKQEFPWQEIEFKKNYFHDDKWNKSSWEKFDNIVNLAQKYHLTVIARVDHAPEWAKSSGNPAAPLAKNSDLADFIVALLDHYQGQIKYVQVWNEPNLSAEWVPGKPADPSGYAAMLKAVYPVVKAAHPEAVILSAPMAMTTEKVSDRGNMNELDYWAGLYDAGAKADFDIASANGYGLDQPPDAAPDPKVLNFRRVELLRDIMVKNGDEGKPVWFDEYGWNASPDTLSEAEKNYWRHVSPATQAKWTVDGINYARKHWPWAGVISIWYFRQVGDIPPDKAEYYFAMVNPDFTSNPIYDAVKADASKYPGPSVQQPSTPSAQVTPTTAAATPSAPAATATATTTATPGTTALPSPTADSAVVAGSSGSNIFLYILGAILVIAGLGGLGYYFVRSRSA